MHAYVHAYVTAKRGVITRVLWHFVSFAVVLAIAKTVCEGSIGAPLQHSPGMCLSLCYSLPCMAISRYVCICVYVCEFEVVYTYVCVFVCIFKKRKLLCVVFSSHISMPFVCLSPQLLSHALVLSPWRQIPMFIPPTTLNQLLTCHSISSDTLCWRWPWWNQFR